MRIFLPFSQEFSNRVTCTIQQSCHFVSNRFSLNLFSKLNRIRLNFMKNIYERVESNTFLFYEVYIYIYKSMK